jgi:hypothetical protein
MSEDVLARLKSASKAEFALFSPITAQTRQKTTSSPPFGNRRLLFCFAEPMHHIQKSTCPHTPLHAPRTQHTSLLLLLVVIIIITVRQSEGIIRAPRPGPRLAPVPLPHHSQIKPRHPCDRPPCACRGGCGCGGKGIGAGCCLCLAVLQGHGDLVLGQQRAEVGRVRLEVLELGVLTTRGRGGEKERGLVTVH